MQHFEKGWALIKAPSDGADPVGPGGVVTGALLRYFEANGYTNAVGWPTGPAVTDAHGTYQRFDALDGSVWGALVTTPSGGTVRIKYGMSNNYFGKNLRSQLGAPLGEEIDTWRAGGGGHAQNFVNGWATYKSVSAMGWFPKSFSFAWLDFDKKGWPTSGAYGACGASKVDQARGYTATGDRWCPSTGLQPIDVLPAVTSPSVLQYHPTDSTGRMGDGGLKVWLFMKSLKHWNMGSEGGAPLSIIDGDRRSELMTFQDREGLSKSGNLDTATWGAMRTGLPWNIDVRQASVKAGRAATRDGHVDALVNYALSLTGKPYIYGAGDAAYGADCSGLALQAVHAAGLNPSATILSDIRYPMFLAEAMWRSDGMNRTVFPSTLTQGSRRSALQRGDLAYYTNGKKNADGSYHISHVAVVTRLGYAVDAEYTTVRTQERTLGKVQDGGLSLVGYQRPFGAQR